MGGTILLIHGSVTTVSSEEFFGARRRAERAEELLRESLRYIADGNFHAKVYAALGEEKPPLDKLGVSKTGK